MIFIHSKFQNVSTTQDIIQAFLRISIGFAVDSIGFESDSMCGP